MLLKSVTESGFHQSSGLYINSSGGVCDGVKLQAFIVNDNEKVNGGVCF